MSRYEPKVSIVIPAYNAANYLGEAIDSALAQTYNNIEIIVVNDGSRDNGATESVAKTYGDKIIYISKENGGSSSALNAGIRNMTGEWFSWLSHDDLYYPNKLAEEIDLLNKFLDEGVSHDDLYKHILFGAADLIDGEGKIIRKETAKNIKKTDKKINCPDGTLNLIAIPTQDGFHGCSCLVHKRAFDEIGVFDEHLRLLNDMDLWFRFYTNDYKIHFVPKVLVCGRVHAKQVSRSIGFSYHNPEQDMFWSRSLGWLKQNHPDNYQLFYLFGKTALLKTRYKEGYRAFELAATISPKNKVRLNIEKSYLILISKIRDILKKVYLRVFSR
jgi:glycosyltransferase involved in cell wall biosynthesis